MENFIQGVCRTNLDDYNVDEVKLFASVPLKGEKVQCRYKGEVTSLKVVEITHSLKEGKPFIIVELNK